MMSDWATKWFSQSRAEPPVMQRARLKRRLGFYVTGLLALLSSVPLAVLTARIYGAWPDQPERATQIVALVFVGFVMLPSAVYLGIRRRAATFSTLTLIILSAIGIVLIASYLHVVSFEIFFPADILIWSETDFVNDILKFHQGYPLFTAQVNNESFHYLPGAQLLTYLLAWLSGHPWSIPAYRLIQLLYSVLAAIVGASCVRQLIEVVRPSIKLKDELWWGAACVTLLFLMATNSLTNSFTHLLHNDSLAQLVTMIAFWLSLRYAITGDKRLLWVMALVPVAGFWVKQNSAIWALFYCLQLTLFDQSRSMKRVLLFALTTFGALAISVAVAYLMWGEPFIFWIFVVLGRHAVSPLRSFKHVLDVWPYFAIGLLAGMILVRDKNFKVLLGPWLIWLSLISLEAYTSGIAGMLNHIGPGSLIAGVWFLAAATVIWPEVFDSKLSNLEPQKWLRAASGLAIVCLLFSGLGVVRVPIRPFGEDAYRYVRQIEKEFDGQASERVLLDMGTWVYVRPGVVMKDRAPAIGERGTSQTGDFSGIIQRLNEKRYAKILVRNLHDPAFWYDNGGWIKSSGIRAALLNNYREIGKIEPVIPGPTAPYVPYGFSEINILIPK